MLIDEINRANVSRVFGELLSLIEPDKRAGTPNAMTVSLAYSGRAFSVPANVDIYATMNTQDHSLAPLDMALRRRFRFINCPPQPELLPIINLNKGLEIVDEAESINVAKVLTGLNHRISQTLGIEAQMGHAFLFSVHSLEQLQMALTEQIIPQLAQAAGGQVPVLQYIFRDEQQPISAQFIHDSQTLIHNGMPTQMASENGIASQNSMFAEQQSYFTQSINAGSYAINTDLIANNGKFTQLAVYQRLYP